MGSVYPAFPPSNPVTKLQQLASSCPDRVYARLLEGDWRTNGPREVTMRELSTAVNRMSFWLDEELGASKNFDPFVYYGDADIRYTFAIFAAIKTQRKIVLVDGASNHDGLIHVLEDLHCTQWVAAEGTTSFAQSLLSKIPRVTIKTLPPLDYWLQDVECPEYLYTKSWEESLWDPVWVMQTSGSTGKPKSFIHTQAFASMFNHTRRHDGETMENPELLHACLTGTSCLWLPRPYWLGGAIGYICFPMYCNMSLVLPPSDTVFPTLGLIEDILATINMDGAFMSPSLFRDLCLDEQNIERLRSLKYILYAGAPLDQWVGDLLCEHTFISSIIGSTEIGPLWVNKPRHRKDWKYLRFDERNGHRMEPVADGLFEMVLHRTPELEQYQGAFVTFPHIQSYRTSDLFEKHPVHDDQWIHRGRADDMFKLKWMTRVKANEIESEIERHEMISRVMVGGQNRPHPFAIVEMSLKADMKDGGSAPTETLKEQIWAMFERVNMTLLPEVKIPRSHIILADADKPLLRLVKGTLNRPGINAEYADKIEQLYRKEDDE
ncbi:hypothetical protein NKR23_g7961 [Pleurostoma richardsiae]|uniref:AMP-dependent synthetase/ligase domain-containing protein n=1 Tax=Pleurostoma richardsiae TaxID=41990 RepID=A0AA38RGU0_9PEZI|nr:hypothetical protein NKR23_g7961 [Pleurostoma richardsiae]